MDRADVPLPVMTEAMLACDLAQVLRIERRAFANPWGPAAFLSELRNPRSRRLVIRDQEGGTVLAYAIGWLAGDELTIANLAVDPARRRTGYAKSLVQSLTSWAVRAGASRAFLEVRRANEPARALYRTLGFSQVGIRAGYYVCDGDDALLLALDLGQSKSDTLMAEGEAWR